MPVPTTAVRNRLFCVTLDWNPSNSEEGDYQSNTWAPTEEEAIRNIAEEMADSGQVTFDSEADRIEFIKALIDGAGPYSAAEVSSSLLSDVHELMTAGEDDLSPAAMEDFKAVAEILAKYGAHNPFPNLGGNSFTCLPYAYVDGANYKKHGAIYVTPALSDVDLEAIEQCLDDGQFFIPHDLQCDIKELQSAMDGFPSEHDHVWHTLYTDQAEQVDAAPDGAPVVDSSKFIQAFRCCKENWKEAAASERLGIGR